MCSPWVDTRWFMHVKRRRTTTTSWHGPTTHNSLSYQPYLVQHQRCPHRAWPDARRHVTCHSGSRKTTTNNHLRLFDPDIKGVWRNAMQHYHYTTAHHWCFITNKHHNKGVDSCIVPKIWVTSTVSGLLRACRTAHTQQVRELVGGGLQRSTTAAALVLIDSHVPGSLGHSP